MQKRTKKLINRRLQLRLTLVFVALACIASSLEILLVDFALDRAIDESGLNAAAIETTPILFASMGLSLLVLIPVMLLVGLLETHRIAGPAYRFEQHLKAVANGENPGRCVIRKGDAFQELCDHINQVCDRVSTQPAVESEPANETSKAA